MNKIVTFFTRKSLAKNILLSLSVACTVISIFCYALYYYNTFRILENLLAKQTRSQLLLNNLHMAESFETLSMISDNLLNDLYQYDTSYPLSYISKLNEITSLHDTESIQFASYTLNTLDFYISNYPMLDSIFLYARNGTVISSTGKHTKTQIMCSESSDFIIDSVIPNFDEQNTSFIWLGSYNIHDFVLGSSQNHFSQNPVRVFTGIRRVVNHKSGTDAFLIFNVRLDTIHDIYYTFPIAGDVGSVFLLDSSGKIHFSNQKELIGSLSPYAGHLTQTGSFVSFTENHHGERHNIFYQSLDNTDLFILYEIPASTYASDIISIRNMSVLLTVCTISVLLFIVFRVVIRKLRPIHELTQAVAYVGSGNLGYTIHVQEKSKDEIGILAKNFNQMSQSIQTIMLEKEQAEEQKRLQEIAALQAQINPHFILNTINTIKWMAILNHAPNISECLTTFGKLLEPLLKQQTDFYTIKEELTYLQNYVTIMNYSYGNTIHMKLEVPEELYTYKIPRFILQPLLENAVFHGVNKETNSVQIEILMTAREETLCIAVLSTGTAIAPDKLLNIQDSLKDPSSAPAGRSSSIGLANVNQRIKLFYGDSFGLWIENSSDCQVRVTVTIPMESML